jgi:Copper type II ascorbate-dependent monooxygenase, C-terminal domain/Copper type II ascorbate-dependent monooxygenase, N-terminal domain
VLDDIGPCEGMRPSAAYASSTPGKDTMIAVQLGHSPAFRQGMTVPIVLALSAFGLVLGACGTAETGAEYDSGAAPTTVPPWDAASAAFDGGWQSTGWDAAPGGPTPVAPQVTSSDTDLPCGVATVLASTCWECHGKTLNFGAPMALLSSADFKATSKLTSSHTEGALTLARIADAANPMPPKFHPQQLDDAAKKTLSDWVNAGMLPRSSSELGCELPAVPQPGTFDSLPTGGPGDCDSYYELRAHGQPQLTDKTGFDVPANPIDSNNMYECFYFDAPYEAGSQGLWFAPLVDNAQVLHHWLLYGADDETALSGAPGTFSSCVASEPGRWLIAGWAPGAPAVTMPAGVGLKMSKKLVLEVHYYNNTGAAAKDRSGVKFCTANQGARPHTAGVHFTGSEGICIDPGSKREVAGQCSPDYDKGDNGDIHIVNVWPHMHLASYRMRIVINRATGGQEVLHDEPFDFNNQLAWPKQDVVLHRGDTMETRCYYDNKTTERVHFGERTQDEMCYGFITAWPAGSLVTAGVLLNPINWVALPIQPALRCLDPTGILQSCNGIADYPK